mmetsp:Transcript_19691/g.33781  ORF Transcript_19691/g.33781 Transcript_19691/m.33781 type:complete len:217 (+) Transcript_19691:533-1183(+)
MAGRAGRLKELGGDLGEGGALALLEGDVGVQGLARHAVDEVAQAIRQAVQVRCIDLLDVAREDDLGALAGARDDRLHLQRRQVLRLVHDEEHLLKASAADVGEGRDDQLLAVEHVLDVLPSPRRGRLLLRLLGVAVRVAGGRGGKLVLDDTQVVVEGLHVRVDLGVHVPRQVPDVAVAEGDDGPGEVDLLVSVLLLQRRRQRQQRLPRPRRPRHRH